MHVFTWSAIPEALPVLWTGLLITFNITALVVGIGIGIGISRGTVLAVFRLSGLRAFEWFATTYVTVFLSIPLVMELLAF